jgi:hypothetical protein
MRASERSNFEQLALTDERRIKASLARQISRQSRARAMINQQITLAFGARAALPKIIECDHQIISAGS